MYGTGKKHKWRKSESLQSGDFSIPVWVRDVVKSRLTRAALDEAGCRGFFPRQVKSKIVHQYTDDDYVVRFKLWEDGVRVSGTYIARYDTGYGESRSVWRVTVRRPLPEWPRRYRVIKAEWLAGRRVGRPDYANLCGRILLRDDTPAE